MPLFARAPRFRRLSAASLMALALGGCSETGELVRPNNPTAADARGTQSVVVIEAPGSPLVVDWQPEQRGDLEVAMREGVAIVGFGKEGLRLLPDCHIDGKYGFIGVNTKEQVVRLVSGEEVQANLAADAVGIIAKLGAELGTSQALDIAIVMVGKRKTTWSSAKRADLTGKCAGATHFVRGASVGAFAMRSGAKGTARTVAEIFGAGAAASTGSEKTVQNADGLLDACKKATPEADNPPPQCGALIRLELVALEGDATPAKPAVAAPEETKAPSAQSEAGDACGPGFVFADGKCTKAETASHHACKPNEPADCATQCDKGDGESCNTLGVLTWHGEGVRADRAGATAFFDKACKQSSPEGCANFASSLRTGLGVTKDLARAVELSLKACGDGVAAACYAAGNDLFFGQGVPTDRERAVRILDLACRGGEHQACSDLGVSVLGGLGGLRKNDGVAADLFKRACDGGALVGCTNYAYMVEFGKGVPKDIPRAANIYGRACTASAAECIWSGVVAQGAIGSGYDPNKARAGFQKTCALSAANPSGGVEAVSCVIMNEIFGAKETIQKDGLKAGASYWDETCKAGTERDCTLLGVTAWGLGDLPAARRIIADACKLGDPWACSLRGHAKLK